MSNHTMALSLKTENDNSKTLASDRQTDHAIETAAKSNGEVGTERFPWVIDDVGSGP
jgi:hypothetical protein